jgi:F0F1-type ATP synthase assembly protein I
MPGENKKKNWAQIGDYISLGFTLPACTVTGYYIGVLLDHYLHTTYLNIVFLMLGIVAGFVELIRVVTKKAK